MKSATELARRIEAGIETKEGRYDWASKVEVRAYVRRETENFGRMVAELDEEIVGLKGRIAELELSWWRRFRRALARKAQ